QGTCGLGDRLRRTELVEIVIGGVYRLVGNGTVEHELFVALDRIEILRRLGEIADALRLRLRRRERRRSHAGRRCDERAPIEEQRLGRGDVLGQLPATAADDMHQRAPSVPVLQEIRGRPVTGKSPKGEHWCGALVRRARTARVPRWQNCLPWCDA